MWYFVVCIRYTYMSVIVCMCLFYIFLYYFRMYMNGRLPPVQLLVCIHVFVLFEAWKLLCFTSSFIRNMQKASPRIAAEILND